MSEVRCVSVGYQGKSLDALCDQLLVAGVEILIDVRERAWSQRPQFRKGLLSSALESRGIRYIHLREAGNPFRPRPGENISAKECMRKYRKHLAAAPGVLDVLDGLMSAGTAALLCYEAATSDCHRGILISALSARQSLAIDHL